MTVHYGPSALISPIPDIARGLNAIAMALVSREGALWDANRGFLQLLRGMPHGGELTDVRSAFAEPDFEALRSGRADPIEKVVHRGVLRLRDADGRITPLSGSVFAYDDDLLLVAEHDIGELATLRAKLLEAGDALGERDQTIARLERELRQASNLAEAALRDRDTLLDALSSGSS